MSITDELRAYVTNGSLHCYSDYIAIADRIDAAHKKAEDKQKANNGDVWLRGYEACREELMEGHQVIAAADLEKAGLVRLPVDDDGVPIHVGDMMDKGKVTCIRDCGKGWEVVLNDLYTYDALSLRHYHAPTVEDVMVEFATDWESAQDGEDKTAVLKEYATKLRLADDGEEQ